MDGIALLHRADPGWRLVGEVAPDSAALTEELALLRDDARRLDPGPLLSKIVIPNEQIRFMSIDTGAVTEHRRIALIEAALNGATPYELDELSYAWSVSGDITLIAAVANETLDEAESFAANHGFGPVAFVARPDRKDFIGEAFFGECAEARRLLPPGTSVERDLLAIQVIGPAIVPTPPAPILPLEVHPAPPAAPPADSLVPAPEVVFGSRRAASPKPKAEAPGADPVPTFESRSAASDDPAPVAPTRSSPAAPAPVPTFGSRRARAEAAPSLPDAPSIRAPRSQARNETAAFDAAMPEVQFRTRLDPPPLAPPAEPLFSSARAQREGAAPPLEGVSRTEPPVSAPKPLLPDAGEDARDDDSATGGERETAEIDSTEAAFQAPDIAEAAPATPDPVVVDPTRAAPNDTTRSLIERLAARRRATSPDPIPVKKTGVLAGLRDKLPRRSDSSDNGAKAPIPTRLISEATATQKAAAASPRLDRNAEAQRMTVFGARAAQTTPRGGLGLVMLVLFLVGSGAWAALFLSDAMSGLLRPEAARLAEADPAAAEKDPESTADIELARTQTAPEQPAPREPIRQRSVEPGPRNLPPVMAEPDPETEARYAATGVWMSAPYVAPSPLPESLDDLYVASIDPVISPLDAVALPMPDAARTDGRPDRVANPAPPGTRFDLDERGLVRASPDGALSPDGVTIYAGQPGRVPPARPAETLQDNLTQVVAALAQKRPKLRPGDLVERNERLNLGGYSRVELAAIRPRLRPALPEARQRAVDEAAAAAAANAAPAATDTPVPDDAAAPSDFDSGTALAVAASRRPAVRPGNMESIVAAAAQASIRPVVAVAPAQSVQPAIPSKASVTRQATVRDAIDLNKINLIGVYGQPASRRALVRMSDGRYRKVKVGDSIDGGRISSIGDGELRYTKGGRNHVLRMPKG
ncbi:hypothetical protein [Pseudooceanicola sp.]|uniref:hypothetical protein n=1 Tax=Pseudooceanicola sp. TaxID=1914328 RepID=UPI0026271FD0|nr:hypothetical protein [Pseudooceanicola sp.]